MVVDVVDTSFLYESAPMYVTDQPSFINCDCACIVETNLPSLKLLQLVKAIEKTVGRVPSIRNGPRAVDLDVILYDDAVIDTRRNPRTELDDLEGELVVPHPRLAEPLTNFICSMIPHFIHPVLYRTVSTLLAALEVPADAAPMCKAIPFPHCPLPADCVFPHTSIDVVPPTLTHWTYPPAHNPTSRRHASHQTRIMATLNATPDSFSDGAAHNTPTTALEYVQSAVAAGSSIVDVGGYSTRPRAAFVSADEETTRVGSCITAIRAAHAQLPISVDTLRPEVARAAILAGANCINDVYAFTGQDSYPFSDASHPDDAARRSDPPRALLAGRSPLCISQHLSSRFLSISSFVRHRVGSTSRDECRATAVVADVSVGREN
ncbi:Dihydropteroate synthase-like protein [Mycena vitilis]|nr:Dihydropteroate synthase-like protein [Mycena vitilis]